MVNVKNTSYHRELEKKIEKHGGLFNAHAHVDRAFTAGALYMSPKGLKEKQSYTGILHRGEFYQKQSLYARISKFLEESAELGIRRVDSFIDVATDIPLDDGLGALNVALEAKDDFKDIIDFRVGAYPIFGFKDSDPKRWDIFVEAAKKADFIGTLPERDDHEFYGNGKDHIGFEEHFLRTLQLGVELKKPLHYHVDQQNNPNEYGTDTLIDAIRWSRVSDEIKRLGKNEPFVWAVHSISPSRYGEARFNKLLDGFERYNVGINVCPDAAISMRQLSIYSSPIGNSIANVLPFLERGIPVRVGIDNVDDDFMRLNTCDVRDQITNLANYIRFDQNPSILAKLGCGKLLDADDINYVSDFLEVERDYLSKLKKNGCN